MRILIETQQMGYTIEYMKVNTDLEKSHRMQHRKKMDTSYQSIKRQGLKEENATHV